MYNPRILQLVKFCIENGIEFLYCHSKEDHSEAIEIIVRKHMATSLKILHEDAIKMFTDIYVDSSSDNIIFKCERIDKFNPMLFDHEFDILLGVLSRFKDDVESFENSEYDTFFEYVFQELDGSKILQDYRRLKILHDRLKESND